MLKVFQWNDDEVYLAGDESSLLELARALERAKLNRGRAEACGLEIVHRHGEEILRMSDGTIYGNLVGLEELSAAVYVQTPKQTSAAEELLLGKEVAEATERERESFNPLPAIAGRPPFHVFVVFNREPEQMEPQNGSDLVDHEHYVRLLTGQKILRDIRRGTDSQAE